jgi:hypothetical protein
MNEMPRDWNNQQGWENYYSSLYPNGNFQDECSWTGSISLDRIEGLANELRESSAKSIWFSGCGISLLPKVLAQRGFEVYATDISPTAINFQNSSDERIQELIDKKITLENDKLGKLIAEVQDFRQPFKNNFFDLVINVKAFQGFNSETMESIAKVHFDALKPSRNAIFDTMNVQGERRDMLEESLVKVGFLIPFHELNRWYRTKLSETGIPYVFILGRPMIARTGIYSNNEPKVEEDMKILHEISAEFYRKQQESLEAEQAKLNNPNGKIASIIYSTG